MRSVAARPHPAYCTKVVGHVTNGGPYSDNISPAMETP